jgi:hypothetical protein
VKAASARTLLLRVPGGDDERTTNSARRSACVIFTSIYFAISPDLSKQFTGLLIAQNPPYQTPGERLPPGQPLLDLHGPEDNLLLGVTQPWLQRALVVDKHHRGQDSLR